MAADPYGRFRGTRRPPAAEEAPRELRLYGLNAVRAAFARRPEALRKLYLAEARIPALQPLLREDSDLLSRVAANNTATATSVKEETAPTL